MCKLVIKTNYIADPSEARAALIKPSQRNAFRYAALIQQEKNKQIKLKYALEIKRKQQQLDILKRQAHIRASIFRDEIAVHELRHIMMDADANVQAIKEGDEHHCNQPPKLLWDPVKQECVATL